MKKYYCDICGKINPEYTNSIYYMLPSFDWINNICKKCRSRLDRMGEDIRQAYLERMKNCMTDEIVKIREERER